MRSFGRPLKADTVTGDVSSRPRKARDEAAADRIGKEPENDGNGARLLQQLRSGGRALRKNEVRLQRDEFLGELLHQFLVERRPASFDPNVAAIRPPELLKSVPECCDKALCLQVAFGKSHQHSDPPHRLGLLRAHRERPSCRRSANQRDELASLHCLPEA